MATLVAVAAFVAATWLYGPTPRHDALPSSTEAAPAPSMLDNAVSRVQEAVRSVAPPASGLTPVALTAARLQEAGPLMGAAEARLIEIYQLIGAARHREALKQAEALVRAHPNFQLAHLVHGDLLSLQTRPVRQLGDVPDTKAMAASAQLSALREESHRRLLALTERPPEGSVPTQFLTLSPQSRHAIAIDASRSRLYLFENLNSARNAIAGDADRLPRLKLLGDFYISVGLSGIEKTHEGDKRTPLGVYYITSTLNPADLPDLYGVGALPINYPNPLDVQRGKTGSGIWLHGTPSDQFVRAPQASDGCVVLSNPDLQRLLNTVQIRTTPVVIASSLQWVRPETLAEDREQFQSVLEAWRQARGAGKADELKAFYSTRFMHQGRDLSQWWPRVEGELRANGGRELQMKDLSVLHWRDQDDTMVVTFGEVAVGQSRGVTKRQYWVREQNRWTIFFEGTI
ncbi:L,D-transpeptidase family protein [Hydrogenophaga laconesensis]|uniref:Lipoprotein-anchoring transpeptidase ErfK/SrfK n=1 Tax=Hydrogenophaga laconesensis TaxID=1805971 RepID=A0ABU1V5H7_9BURK|nr:L,D-transpeptidase [Hydrogenophaga laconesensis]MDR7092712.1 lipoprotein-anchoring transpeptidase ErfK/SrfK [Hydrogenophaga laconesensis]